jgi:hypothetical protein
MRSRGPLNAVYKCPFLAPACLELRETPDPTLFAIASASLVALLIMISGLAPCGTHHKNRDGNVADVTLRA